MSIEEKRREAFEAWAKLHGLDRIGKIAGYTGRVADHPAMGGYWHGWNAALDSVEIELPTPEESYGSMGEGMGDPWLSYDMDAVKAAIEACGLKVKV